MHRRSVALHLVRAHAIRAVVVVAAVLLTLLPSRLAHATVIAGGNIINQTWSSAGNPYLVQGDITVPSGAFLTIQPGTIVQFASSDGQASGLDPSRVELTVKGTLDASGTAASPITFHAQSGNGVAIWSGIIIDVAATSATLAHVDIQNAVVGVTSGSPGTALGMTSSSIGTSQIGIVVSAGTPVLDGLVISGMTLAGIYTSSGGTISRCVIQSSGNYGIYAPVTSGNVTLTIVDTVIKSGNFKGVYLEASGGSLTATIMSSTIHACGSNSVHAYAGVGATTTLNITNSIITQSGATGVYRDAGGGTVTVATTYSDVWGNAAGNYFATVAGAGSISQNPNYVMAPGNLQLQMGSACIDAGTMNGAPGTDLDGAVRPQDGDGINGAAWDMGAYEAAAAASCGDGIQQVGEGCDEGTLNGAYGHCKPDCSSQGPHCGDGLVNGTEYVFRITAITSLGLGSASPTSAVVHPANVPVAVTAPAAVAGNGASALSWAAAVSDGGSPVTDYRINSRRTAVPVGRCSATVSPPLGRRR